MRELKVVSDSPGLVDFAFGLVNSVFNLPEGQINFFLEGGGGFILEKNCNQSCSSKIFFGLIKMLVGLVHASCSLLEWRAIKQNFFAP